MRSKSVRGGRLMARRFRLGNLAPARIPERPSAPPHPPVTAFAEGPRQLASCGAINVRFLFLKCCKADIYDCATCLICELDRRNLDACGWPADWGRTPCRRGGAGRLRTYK